ncbi:unnamed protein product [Spirodela intermedia]|uniref:Uncharacterized protein n=1 Tax=Spirodela intermedia TaxID=51605 RepID=A0A7I8L735_SPIIN|nr:unnamed protein product [Spirodela intermedia]
MEAPGCGLPLMKGGEAETSYARNSSVQRTFVEEAWPITEEAVFKLICGINGDKLTLADLGCSSGPNTLSIVANVLDSVEEGRRRFGRTPPEVQVFLNDLPGNDFNTIFLSLQDFYEKREALKGAEGLCRCFVAGTAGSFHGRLFPSRSIHLFHSSSSLHWLSQDPLKTQAERGMFLNKGNIYISEESLPSVVDAYTRQFQSDFSGFLKSRSVEIVAGGRMVLTIPVRTSLDPAQEEFIRIWNLLSQALKDLVQEGHIKEEDVDTFNLPLYLPLALEVEQEIHKEASFSVECLKVFETRLNLLLEHATVSIPQSITNCVQAVLEPLLVRHFGSDIIEALFSKYKKMIEEDRSIVKVKLSNLVVSLVYKV